MYKLILKSYHTTGKRYHWKDNWWTCLKIYFYNFRLRSLAKSELRRLSKPLTHEFNG
jgi:hypothetical protein